MLLKGGFGSFLEQGVNTLVQVITRHEVVDDAETGDVNGPLVLPRLHIVRHLGQFALLFNDFDRFTTRTALAVPDTLLFSFHRLFLSWPILIKDWFINWCRIRRVRFLLLGGLGISLGPSSLRLETLEGVENVAKCQVAVVMNEVRGLRGPHLEKLLENAALVVIVCCSSNELLNLLRWCAEPAK